MATIIKGLLAQDLPWSLVFIGFAIAVVVELCGVSWLGNLVGKRHTHASRLMTKMQRAQVTYCVNYSMNTVHA